MRHEVGKKEGIPRRTRKAVTLGSLAKGDTEVYILKKIR